MDSFLLLTSSLYAITVKGVASQLPTEIPENPCFLLFASCFLLLASCFLRLSSCFLLFASCFLLLASCFLLLASCFLLLRLSAFRLLDSGVSSAATMGAAMERLQVREWHRHFDGRG